MWDTQAPNPGQHQQTCGNCGQGAMVFDGYSQNGKYMYFKCGLCAYTLVRPNPDPRRAPGYLTGESD